MKKLIYSLLLLATLQACEKSDLNTINEGTELPVVQAYLAQGQRVLVTA